MASLPGTTKRAAGVRETTRLSPSPGQGGLGSSPTPVAEWRNRWREGATPLRRTLITNPSRSRSLVAPTSKDRRTDRVEVSALLPQPGGFEGLGLGLDLEPEQRTVSILKSYGYVISSHTLDLSGPRRRPQRLLNRPTK